MRREIGRLVDLDEPRAQVLVEHKVEAVDLEGVTPRLRTLRAAAHGRGGYAPQRGQDGLCPRLTQAARAQVLGELRAAPQGASERRALALGRRRGGELGRRARPEARRGAR